MLNSYPQAQGADHRPAVTRSIWRYTFGMLFLCIPLVPLTGFDSLPMATIGAAAFATWGVWVFGRLPKPPKPERDPAVAELEKQVASLSERLENVEVLNRFEERLAREKVGVSAEKEWALAGSRSEG